MEKELPEAWKISTVKDVVKYQKGKKPKVLKDAYFEKSVPYLDIHAFEKGVVRQYADEESSNLIDEKSIGIVWDGARSGWVTKGQKGAIGSTIAKLTPINLDVDYLYRFLQSKFHDINTNTRGTGIPHVDPAYLWSIPIPLPPLPEQERIVAKLDTLFAHLEQTKKRLEQIPVLLKQFRQAVLTQAVTGKLTEEWREGKELDWEVKNVSQISESLSGYAFKSSDFSNEGIQLIRMGNLYNNKLDLSRNPIYIPVDYDSKILKKYSVKNGDILLTLTGTKYKRDYGFAIKVNTEKQLLLNQRILALRPKINNDYFLIALQQDIFRDQFFDSETGGVNQGNVGVKNVLDIKLSIPCEVEQTEIVRRVESLFAKADALEARYKVLKELVDKLPQALLGKAFRGEV